MTHAAPTAIDLRTSGDLLADRRYAYGQALADEGDPVAAADLFAQAADLAPHWAPAWLALGEAHAKTGDDARAIAALRRAAMQDPTGVLGVSLLLAALDGGAPSTAAPAYVAALFDGYAGRFDEHLVAALAYRGPDLLRAALDRVAPGRRFARAYDLGCGTGLMGAAIRDRVDWLGGVDLSAAMVEKARGKGIYAALHVGEMLAALPAHTAQDLVLAADVLVYVGDLRPVFAAVKAALAPAGLFAFTLQSAPPRDDFEVGVVVGADRRFAHSPDHVHARAAEAGFAILVCDAVSTRRDAGADVPGLVVVATRP